MRRNGGDQRNRAGRDRGQATVEFALVLPLLVLCIAGLVWVGNLMVTQVRLEHAAREGARAAAVEPEQAAAVARAAIRRSFGDAEAQTRTDGDFVVVEVTAEVAGVPLINVGARRLVATAHMRREDRIDP